jgi:hypothetical protein
MKLSVGSVTFLLAALATAYPANGNNNGQGVASNTNAGNSASNNGANTNANSGAGATASSNAGNNTASAQGGNSNANGTNGTPGQPAIQDGNNDVNAAGTISGQNALLVNTAITAWMRDTGVVSNFLNIGPTIQDDATFRNQAQIAHSAEVDELTQKAVLDQFVQNQNVAQANATLSNGAFQLVVDRLDDMARQGLAQKNAINDINNV